MPVKIRALFLIAAYVGLLVGIQIMGAAPAPTDRGAWAVGVVYNANDTVTYDGSIYRCIEAHVSQVAWTPPVTTTEWQLIRDYPTASVYTDIGATSINSAYRATGQRYYTLATILAEPEACVPAWGGTHPMLENYYGDEISTLRSAGGDVNADFGGSRATDLAAVCTTSDNLESVYQQVLDQYQFKWFDWNIAGEMLSDQVSLDRRNKAIAALQSNNPSLRVSYTLPAMQTGLSQAALDLLSNAKANGVRIDYINILAMNYGLAETDMGQAAIRAATHAHAQLVKLGFSSKIGVTVMIGQNDSAGEVFSLANADALIAFAQGNNTIGWLSFRSLERDHGGCAGSTVASASCSGIAQDDYAFTNKFKAFP